LIGHNLKYFLYTLTTGKCWGCSFTVSSELSLHGVVSPDPRHEDATTAPWLEEARWMPNNYLAENNKMTTFSSRTSGSTRLGGRQEIGTLKPVHTRQQIVAENGNKVAVSGNNLLPGNFVAGCGQAFRHQVVSAATLH